MCFACMWAEVRSPAASDRRILDSRAGKIFPLTQWRGANSHYKNVELCRPVVWLREANRFISSAQSYACLSGTHTCAVAICIGMLGLQNDIATSMQLLQDFTLWNPPLSVLDRLGPVFSDLPVLLLSLYILAFLQTGDGSTRHLIEMNQLCHGRAASVVSHLLPGLWYWFRDWFREVPL